MNLIFFMNSIFAFSQGIFFLVTIFEEFFCVKKIIRYMSIVKKKKVKCTRDPFKIKNCVKVNENT